MSAAARGGARVRSGYGKVAGMPARRRRRRPPAAIPDNREFFLIHFLTFNLILFHIIKSYKIVDKNPRFPLFITVTSNSLY